ncbi:MAG: hypothetical protein U1E26_12760, partial [Coriobacteriia bacterium]|nr:hypothetical protein [Coriobacteriia bacterium]
LIPEAADDREAFAVLTSFADAASLSAYHVDKLMWLVGSGEFYRHPGIGSVPTQRDEFVAGELATFAASA